MALLIRLDIIFGVFFEQWYELRSSSSVVEERMRNKNIETLVATEL